MNSGTLPLLVALALCGCVSSPPSTSSGSLLGRTQGASKDAGLAAYKTALKLNPGSAIAMVEYANGLVMLEGDKRMKEATKLYEDAAKVEPQDAMERLDVEMAKAELED